MLLIFLILLISCDSNTNQQDLNCKNVSELKTIEQKNNFLSEIFDTDQALRIGVSKFNVKNAEIIDSINLSKIDCFLNSYGFPDTLNYTEKAIKAPWFVIQHCPFLEKRENYYGILEDAHVVGEITSIQWYLYLIRNYHFKTGNMLGIEEDDQLTFEQKIDIIIDTLKHHEKMNAM